MKIRRMDGLGDPEVTGHYKLALPTRVNSLIVPGREPVG